MDCVTLFMFVSAVIVLTITPGPDLFLIVGRGISQGRAAALFTAFGFFLAGFIQVPLLAVGLANVVAGNPVLFDVLRYGGGAYLMWRGIVMIRNAGHANNFSAGHASAGAAIREGFIASLVNPKSHMFLLAFLPQFVRPENGSVTAQFVFLGILMRVVALLVEGGMAFFAGSIGYRLRQSQQLRSWLERTAGSLLVAVGLRLVLMERPQP
ncbi:LysE family translocator [Cereibacter johrii]|uniref:LysE family translocator n=1 Tax=Cereibacter johrii TaxID=445629 RepID=UPI000DCE9EEC|nr:LysE family translocator [Cereibacter johrii]RAZ83826.1 LysE family translocator [Cereibacter johrii]